jgi:hypothetical protein
MTDFSLFIEKKLAQINLRNNRNNNDVFNPHIHCSNILSALSTNTLYIQKLSPNHHRNEKREKFNNWPNMRTNPHHHLYIVIIIITSPSPTCWLSGTLCIHEVSANHLLHRRCRRQKLQSLSLTHLTQTQQPKTGQWVAESIKQLAS